MATTLSKPLRDGMVAAHTGQLDRARALLAQACAQSPQSATAWYWHGVSCARVTDAIDSMRRAVHLDPSHAAARDALVRLLILEARFVARTDRARAAELLTDAAQNGPNNAEAWIALAQVCDTPAARLTALRRAVTLAPDRTDLKARLRDLLLNAAVDAAKAGNRPEARRLFRELAQLDPSDARVWQALVRLADNAGDAIEGLRRLYDLAAPDKSAARVALKRALVSDAKALEQAGRDADALARWREALTLDPNDVEVLAKLKPAAPAPTMAGRADTGGSPGVPTIMVVDDSPTIRKILTLTLERAGYAVVAEADGERAIARLADLVPDLILLDISMPKLDGYEVCKHIRRDPRISQVPVVMLSGKDGFFDKVKGRMVGATEYLTKPFQAPAVLAVIATHCTRNGEVAHG